MQCPFCAEIIQNKAIICRYCQRDLPSNNTDHSHDNLGAWDSGETLLFERKILI